MKAYYQGKYYDSEKLSQSDKEKLCEEIPRIYYKIFPCSTDLVAKNASNYSIYQIYYDEKSKARMDCNLTPYENVRSKNYENDVIMDVWQTPLWSNNSRYVGVLSWRFAEKTGHSGYELINALDKINADAVVIFPKIYSEYKHPYCKVGFTSVIEMAKIIDAAKIFPFKIEGYKVRQNVWCNYWVARPAIFDDYCKRYLKPCMDILDAYDFKEIHRGKIVPSQTFFYEGLFSVYLTAENIKFKTLVW